MFSLDCPRAPHGASGYSICFLAFGHRPAAARGAALQGKRHLKCEIWVRRGGGPRLTPALTWNDHFPGKVWPSCRCQWFRGQEEAAGVLQRTLGSDELPCPDLHIQDGAGSGSQGERLAEGRKLGH